MPDRDPLGYICVDCGWWIERLTEHDALCPHPRVVQEEHCYSEAVTQAKARKANREMPTWQWDWEAILLDRWRPVIGPFVTGPFHPP